jgi:ABC-type branched-subunit amino acid transport system substrate-binding protein
MTLPTDAIAGLADIDAVVYLGFADNFLRSIEEVRKAGLSVRWFAGDAVIQQKVVESAITASTDIFALGFGVDVEKSADFVSAFEAAYQTEPGVWAYYAYDVAGFLGTVLEQMDIESVTRRLFLDKARDISYEGITGKKGFVFEGTADTGSFDIFHNEDRQWKITGKAVPLKLL